MLAFIILTFQYLHTHSWQCGGDKTSLFIGPSNKRSLLTRSSTLSPIRISYNYYNFDLNNSTLNEIFKNTLMPMVDSFFTTSLKVYSVQSNIVLSSTTCQTVTVPSEHQTTGVADTDVIVYITVNSLTTVSYVAYAGACEKQSDGLGNVIAGAVVVNIPNFSDNTIESWLEIMTHEMTHLLAFSQGLFDYWKTSDGLSYNTDEVTKTLTIRGVEKSFLVSPNVRALAQEAFDCYTIEGIELEEAGQTGTAGSHWDKRIMMNDYMTAYAPTEAIFSNLSLAVFKDTGWYDVDYTLAQMPYFGRKAGCSFIEDLCIINGATSNSELWCDTYTKWGCDYFALNKGGCNVKTYTSDIPTTFQYFSSTTIGGKDIYTDYCPYNPALSNGSCRGNYVTTSVLTRAIEVISHKSRCFESTLMQKPYSTSASVYAACYEVISCSDTTVTIQISTLTVVCNFDGSTITLTGFNGWFKCPSTKMVCSDVPCKNLCFARGSCGHYGTCNCFTGFGGDDCYYECSDHCDQCTSDTICTKCASGYTLENDYCVLGCPNGCLSCDGDVCDSCDSGYFLSSGNCVACVNYCYTCSSASECSLCDNGYYLNSPQECVSCGSYCVTCGSSTYCSQCQESYQGVDGVCSLNCPDNCQSCSSSTVCTLCNSGFYVLNGLCQSCSSNCEKCDSGTVCTQCSQNYQLSSGTCSAVCPSNCLLCDANSNCNLCEPGFIVDTSSTCACTAGYYLSNSQCIKCSTSCLTCSSDTECDSCMPAYYISNYDCISCPSTCATCSSSSYCLTCIAGYTLSSNNCILCPSECSSCSDNNICESCIVGYKLDSNSCISCPSGCYSCTTTECTVCQGSYYLDNGSCSSCPQYCLLCTSTACIKCKPAYYLSNNNCVICSQYCTKCKNGNCLRCLRGFFLLDNECVACSTGCSSCSSLDVCKKCAFSYLLTDGSCVDCPTGCLVCSSNGKCSRCLPGYFFYKQMCYACETNCKICKSFYECYVCSAGFLLSGTSCVS